MRLIDADKLKRVYAQSPSAPLPSLVTGSEIDNAPTVNAIPIEWIVDWLTRQHIPASHTCDDYYAVEMMLDDWEKENETD